MKLLSNKIKLSLTEVYILEISRSGQETVALFVFIFDSLITNLTVKTLLDVNRCPLLELGGIQSS